MKEKRRRNTGKSTLADVAQRVGVSAMTASRALRMPEKVSPVLREKIAAAIAELDYVPNLAASALASASSQLILMVVPSFATPGCAQVSEALQAVLKEAEYSMMLVEANHSASGERQLIERLIAYHPAAMVHFNFDSTDEGRRLLINAGLPVMQVGALHPQPLDVSVGVDYAQAVAALVHQLAGSGYRHLGLLCSQTSGTTLKQIMHGWHSAMLAVNHSPHRVIATTEPPAFATGHQRLSEIRLTWPELDVLICTTDEVACGVIMACHAEGVDVPSQLAVASLGGGDLSAVCSPPLTSVALPYRQMGTLAGEQLLAELRGQEVDARQLLPAPLVVRASTRQR
ncbi:LacI family transcriptional regulator [Lonsdalea britannica]|uniref:LacI family DNA-binding transcriptional regulator n=1 Tax=Lonsdalea britannica TaxID=1082704 RepID=UPI000A1F0136|nr:LacI family DNA-binding transcriptional regulator [Lonsdalea britannica]OSN09680.1 LacI family transcriptional regulator [Lonsdalea britannica]